MVGNRNLSVGIFVTAALASRNVLATIAKLSMPAGKVASLLGDSRRLAALASVIRSTAERIGKQRSELAKKIGLGLKPRARKRGGG